MLYVFAPCVYLVSDDCIGQKYASDPLEMELHEVAMELQVAVSCHCGCWEPNLDPLQEQQVILPAEPPLKPFFLKMLFYF